MPILTRETKARMVPQRDQNGPILKLLEWDYEDGLITGLVEHVGDVRAVETHIQFLANAGGGVRISTASDFISYLHPGEKWSFRAAVDRYEEVKRVDFYQFVCELLEPDWE